MIDATKTEVPQSTLARLDKSTRGWGPGCNAAQVGEVGPFASRKRPDYVWEQSLRRRASAPVYYRRPEVLRSQRSTKTSPPKFGSPFL